LIPSSVKMKLLLYLISLSFVVGCHTPKLPTKKYSQANYHKVYSQENNKLKVEIGNPLRCPLRVWIQTSDTSLQARLNEFNPVILKPTSDTLLVLDNVARLEDNIHFASRLGSVEKEINNIKLELPFVKGATYKVIQGNKTNYTHNSEWSRFAIDFNLNVGDTVCAATSGFVVGVIDQYKYGGKGDEWKPYGNFITIYEPNSGLFTQYVHLTENGSLVKVGEAVERGQPIGLSGKTGQTDIAHLHFNCLIPTNTSEGLKSIPFEFTDGYKSEALQKYDLVKSPE
jgi:murein DD-endopeptidase MepM/ murein hydrolase activator NlpD